MKGLGTISYATFIFPFINFVQLLFSLAKASETKCCWGCLNSTLNQCGSCCSAEVRTYTFNDFAIIISALVGESYVSSSELLLHCSNTTDEQKNQEKIDVPNNQESMKKKDREQEENERKEKEKKEKEKKE